MPYIKQTRRDEINRKLEDLVSKLRNLEHDDIRDLDGDLNYTISNLLISVFDLNDTPKYTKFNTIIGILEAVKLEMYRRLVSPYEDTKIKENGDIL